MPLWFVSKQAVICHTHPHHTCQDVPALASSNDYMQRYFNTSLCGTLPCRFSDHKLVKAGCDRKAYDTISRPLWPARELPRSECRKIHARQKPTLSCIWLPLPHSKQAVIRFEKNTNHNHLDASTMHHSLLSPSSFANWCSYLLKANVYIFY